MSFRDLPEDIIEAILQWLPVKSLLRFQCVRRSWSALIRNPRFIAAHLRINRTFRSKRKLILNQFDDYCLISGEALDRSENLNFPWDSTYIDGVCDGIVCAHLYRDYFLWNPAIRKFKVSPESDIPQQEIGCYFVGFGFDSKTDDYKAIRVVYPYSPQDIQRSEVYSLKSDSWREIKALSPQVMVRNSCCYSSYANGSVLWTGRHLDGATIFVILFDLADEEFRCLGAPPGALSIQARADHACSAAVLNGSIGLLVVDSEGKGSTSVDVWVMNEWGDAGSWVKRFSVAPFPQSLRPLGLIDAVDELLCVNDAGDLACYCLLTGKVKDLRVHAILYLFNTYTESLVPFGGEYGLNIFPNPNYD